MNNRSSKILRLALSSVENQVDVTNDTHSDKKEVIAENSNSYVIQSTSGTKLNLKRVHREFYKENSSDDSGDFSSGSGDEYVPAGNDVSLNSSDSEGENEEPPDDGAPDEEAPNEVRNSPPPNNKAKKRVRKVETWTKVKAKLLKNSGKSYKSKTGKTVEAKQMKPPCSDKCVLSCSTKIDENFRAQVFKEYWQLGCLQRQRDFLSSCTELLAVKYRRVTCAAPRKPNCAFFVLNNGQKTRVCKTFLINTLGIAERTIRSVIQFKVSGTGIIPVDQRGKHGKHRKIGQDVLTSVRNHINAIPRIESHYVRSATTREFIDGGLSIAELHRHYSNEMTSANKTAANYDTYTRIFNTEFNIGFFVPKKDQCDLCESYNNAMNDDKAKLANAYEEHQDEKTMSRNEKDKDKEKAKNQEIVLAVYDLQAVLPVPMAHTSQFFYKSRLNCFNFTVSILIKIVILSLFWLVLYNLIIWS